MQEVGEILVGLNDEQRQAVTSSARVLRVIAGAGSGKTRVLVHRMMWLMMIEQYHPASLMALTFTNKAAREMRSRLEAVMEQPLQQVRMGTFHHICGRILRQYADRMNWSRDFVVMDSEDQLRLIKRLMRETQWAVESINAKDLRSQINSMKEQGMRANDMPVNNNIDALTRNFYLDYERACIQQGRMDFAEMLLLTVELLTQHDAVREHLQARYRAILVDEFQDTNHLQFRFIELMTSATAKLFVVGDDDQSIYSWRGAVVKNILELEQVYPEVETIRLERNYRSTNTILAAANAVIAHNQQRLGKNLWTEENAGELVTIYPAMNEYDEARYVCETIQQRHQEGARYEDCAILYRTNALSRVFEEILIQYGIPYRVTGGLRFFERAEIKDALAYLRTVLTPTDDGALERIINTPSRSIGEKTLNDVRSLARQGGLSLWHILSDAMLLQRHFSARSANALTHFVNLICTMRDDIQQEPSLERALQIVCEKSGLLAQFETSTKDDSESRKENLLELIEAVKRIDVEQPDNPNRIQEFLSDAALDAGEAEAEEGRDAVQLMTLHTAKGLEFDNVFMVAMEEDIFPNSKSQFGEKLEEERRLAYVGITRARKQLTLSFAERRRYLGNETYPRTSRFLHEIPEQFVQAVRPMVFEHVMSERKLQHAMPNTLRDQHADDPYKMGDIVEHAKFGEGCILAFEGDGAGRRALIRFKESGEKWLILAYAKLNVKGKLL